MIVVVITTSPLTPTLHTIYTYYCGLKENVVVHLYVVCGLKIWVVCEMIDS